MSDALTPVASVMAEKAMQDCGMSLPDAQIRNILAWFKQIIREDSDEWKSEIGVEVGGQMGGKLPLGLGSLFAKLTAAIKGTSKHAVTIRDTIRSNPAELIASTARLLDTANTLLRENDRPHGLLLLFDNMNKYTPEQIDRVLVRISEQIVRIKCHAVFTFPIALLFNPGSGKVTSTYTPCIPLPMIALRRREDLWAATVAESAFDDTAIATLRGLLARRLDLNALFERREDVDTLIKMSGGVISDLIQLVIFAVNETENEQRISTGAVGKAVHELRGIYRRMLFITPHDYQCLAHIAQRKPTVTAETDFSEALNRLLFRGCLLEYMQDDAEWYDVHPTLIETEEFRNANAVHTTKKRK